MAGVPITPAAVLRGLKEVKGYKTATGCSPSFHFSFSMCDSALVGCTEAHALKMIERSMAGPWGMAMYIRQYGESGTGHGPSRLYGYRVTRAGVTLVMSENLASDMAAAAAPEAAAASPPSSSLDLFHVSI